MNFLLHISLNTVSMMFQSKTRGNTSADPAADKPCSPQGLPKSSDQRQVGGTSVPHLLTITYSVHQIH